MISIKDKKDCCGCTACMSVCKREAITMTVDSLGFMYPTVNKDKCNNCGLCVEVCAFNKDYDQSNNFEVPNVFAARHKDESEILRSQSGGMFVILTDWILENGGIVYGVGYADYFRAVHKRAETKIERDEFRGSKYVQSDINGCFSEVDKDLSQGKFVFFSGTPCQVAGLVSYLNIKKVDTSKLYTCDIVCHGVPSPNIWKDYISYIENKYNQKIQSVNFRDKSKSGWKSHIESFKLNDKIIFTDSYKYLFYKNIMLRDCCGVCYYTNTQRPSDITIADYWGNEKHIPDFYPDNKGISLVIVNSSKGQYLFDLVTNNINYLKTDISRQSQHNLKKPSWINPKHKQFEADYIKYGFDYVCKKYKIIGWRNKIDRLKVHIILKVKEIINN